jgi:hypothetical protein
VQFGAGEEARGHASKAAAQGSGRLNVDGARVPVGTGVFRIWGWGAMAPPTGAHSTIETSCTVLFHTEKASAVQQEEIMRDLENPDVKVSEQHRAEPLHMQDRAEHRFRVSGQLVGQGQGA